MKSKRVWTTVLAAVLFIGCLISSRLSIDYSVGGSSIAGPGKGADAKVESMNDLLAVFNAIGMEEAADETTALFEPKSATVVVDYKNKGMDVREYYYFADDKMACRSLGTITSKRENIFESVETKLTLDFEFYFTGNLLYMYCHKFEFHITHVHNKVEKGWMKISPKRDAWVPVTSELLSELSIDVMDTVELCKRLFGALGGLLDFFFEVDEVAKEDKNLQVSKTRWKELKTENGDAMPTLWKDCREVSFGVDLTTPRKPKVDLYLKEEETVDCSFLFQNIDNTVIDFDGKFASMKDYSEIKNYWKITMGGELADEI